MRLRYQQGELASFTVRNLLDLCHWYESLLGGQEIELRDKSIELSRLKRENERLKRQAET
jgi:catechol-2,3-dioxygenase